MSASKDEISPPKHRFSRADFDTKRVDKEAAKANTLGNDKPLEQRVEDLEIAVEKIKKTI